MLDIQFSKFKFLTVGRVEWVKLSGDRSNGFWYMAIFRFSKMLDFQNLNFSRVKSVNRVNVRHGAKFRDDQSNHCLDMVIFRFFKMAAAAILDF